MMEIATMSSDHAYIHQEWHRAASTRDTPALLALYADDAILESPLVPVVMDGKGDGVLRGKEKSDGFSRRAPAADPSTLSGGTGRTLIFSAGGTLIWEYPRVTPGGDQVEIVEVMEIAGRLIRHHRIYWGWKGCLLIAAKLARASASG